MALVPCYLSNLVIDEAVQQQSYTVFVATVDGARRISIVIGALEALAIERALKRTAFPRPLTHDLALALIEVQGGRLIEVRIVDVREQTFYAELVLGLANGQLVTVDCRPSDALAILARRSGVPLLVEDRVFGAAH